MRVLPVLIVFATREGHTARVAKRIAEELGRHGVPAALSVATDAPTPTAARFSAVVLAGSVHFGRHAPTLTTYIVENRSALRDLPTMIVSISMSEAIAHHTGASDAQRKAARARAHEAVDKLAVDTGFRPSQIQLVGGGIPYTRLGFFTRQLVRVVAGRQGGPTDTSRDHDLTSWPVVDAVAGVVAKWALPSTVADADVLH